MTQQQPTIHQVQATPLQPLLPRLLLIVGGLLVLIIITFAILYQSPTTAQSTLRVVDGSTSGIHRAYITLTPHHNTVLGFSIYGSFIPGSVQSIQLGTTPTTSTFSVLSKFVDLVHGNFVYAAVAPINHSLTSTTNIVTIVYWIRPGAPLPTFTILPTTLITGKGTTASLYTPLYVFSLFDK